MPETWVQFWGQEDPLKEEMVTHYGITAWKIPWTEEPGGYSPWGHKELGMTEQLTNNKACKMKSQTQWIFLLQY